MPTISLKTATLLTGMSMRTFRRRIADGTLTCAGSDEDYNKTMISLESIKKDIGIALGPDAVELIRAADAGEPQAQNDLGVLFLENDKPQRAVYWLELAAKQDFADAMHLLGTCYLKGNGVAKDHNLALMWIAKAASLGHSIAQAQIKSIRLVD
ncbi:MAG: tetratricopeptide repeat protein [Methylococcales bacterium]|nr:tetratricopeptide repeat protein [Methylococcales bacterium]